MVVILENRSPRSWLLHTLHPSSTSLGDILRTGQEQRAWDQRFPLERWPPAGPGILCRVILYREHQPREEFLVRARFRVTHSGHSRPILIMSGPPSSQSSESSKSFAFVTLVLKIPPACQSECTTGREGKECRIWQWRPSPGAVRYLFIQ